MGKKKKERGKGTVSRSVNNGIQAHSMTSEVTAVGKNARAKKVGGTFASESRSDRLARPLQHAPSPGSPGATWDHDLFISYASEDREALVAPLARALQDLNLRVWLDADRIQLGDVIRRSIDEGLRRSRFALIVLSPSSLGKFWAEVEWDGLLALEHESGHRRVLPILHGVDSADVSAYSPTLASRLAASSSIGVERLARLIHTRLGECRPEDGSSSC